MTTPVESIINSLNEFAENNTSNAAMYRKDSPGNPLAEARAVKCDEMSRLWSRLAQRTNALVGQPTAEQDNAFVRVRAWVDAMSAQADVDEIVAGPPAHDAPYLSLSDLEAVLNGHIALERIAEDAVAELADRKAEATP